MSFEVAEGKTLAVVGESGCGKSVTALSVMRLLPSPPGDIEGGRILLRGRDLLALPERQMRAVRGAQISMIFQEPLTSLNPVYTVGSQIVEAIRIHRKTMRLSAATSVTARPSVAIWATGRPSAGAPAQPHLSAAEILLARRRGKRL